jgi:hypothetical protein
MSRLRLYNLRPREGREIINLFLTRGTASPLSGGRHDEPVLRTGLRLGKDRHGEGVEVANEVSMSQQALPEAAELKARMAPCL